MSLISSVYVFAGYTLVYTHNISAALWLNTHWILINCLWWSCMTLLLTEFVCITVHIPVVSRTFAVCCDANLCVLWWKFLLYYEIWLDLKSDWHCLLTPLKMYSIELALPNLCPYFVFQSLALCPQFCIYLIFSSVGT